jgi:hypothetical protein
MARLSHGRWGCCDCAGREEYRVVADAPGGASDRDSANAALEARNSSHWRHGGSDLAATPALNRAVRGQGAGVEVSRRYGRGAALETRDGHRVRARSDLAVTPALDRAEGGEAAGELITHGHGDEVTSHGPRHRRVTGARAAERPCACRRRGTGIEPAPPSLPYPAAKRLEAPSSTRPPQAALVTRATNPTDAV